MQTLSDLCAKHQVKTISLGDGTGCRSRLYPSLATTIHQVSEGGPAPQWPPPFHNCEALCPVSYWDTASVAQLDHTSCGGRSLRFCFSSLARSLRILTIECCPPQSERCSSSLGLDAQFAVKFSTQKYGEGSLRAPRPRPSPLHPRVRIFSLTPVFLLHSPDIRNRLPTPHPAHPTPPSPPYPTHPTLPHPTRPLRPNSSACANGTFVCGKRGSNELTHGLSNQDHLKPSGRRVKGTEASPANILPRSTPAHPYTPPGYHRPSYSPFRPNPLFRNMEQIIHDAIQRCPKLGLSYVRTSECGASVYSASELAEQELPDLDVTFRGAVSIARRMQVC